MNQTITITPKWQVHIPVAVRDQLGLRKPTTLSVQVKDDAIILKPRKSSILALAGTIDPKAAKKSINIDRIRDEIDYSDL